MSATPRSAPRLSSLATVLVADDDPSITASVSLLLRRHGFRTLDASSPDETLERLAGNEVDLVLQDMNFTRATTGDEGLALLGATRRLYPQVPVVLMTAWGSIDLAVRGMRTGAADFLTKPWTAERLLEVVDTTLRVAAARSLEPASSRDELDERLDLRGLVGRDPALVRILDLVGRVAESDASILITGESGTGKELVAEAVHRNSARRDGPFVKVNLGGVSAGLFESEMFGHVRGAFTDAHQDRLGRFELAEGGTIFLDEIGELDPAAQVKLLRVLQDRTYEVLGSSRTRQADVRIVAATHRDLGTMVSEGTFREDLLYRLNLITLDLPPLRERRGDITLLARHFLRLFGRGSEHGSIELTDDAEAWLQGRSWPGNIRQLRQVLERAVLVGGGPRIDADDLRSLDSMGPKPKDSTSLPEVGAMTLGEMERSMLIKTLRHHEGNITHAARALGLTRASLYRRCEKFAIDPADPR